MGKIFSLMASCFSIIMLFTGCKQIIESDFERQKIVVNGQQFEVLTAWNIFDDYITTKSNYHQDIFERIKDEFNHDPEYPFLLDAIEERIDPNDELSQVVEIMKCIDFSIIVDSTFQQVTKELPGPDTKILFIPSNPAYRKTYREFGVGFHAFTPGTGRIIVSFDPTFENWQQFLPYALAHEYHHSVWTSRNFETADFTPLEYIILEGKADSFATEIFSNTPHPFLNMLEGEKEKHIWNLIKSDMYQRDAELNDKIFYGTEDIPYGSVYAIGFNIIQSLKENDPGILDAELMDMSPVEVLYLSQYDQKMNGL